MIEPWAPMTIVGAGAAGMAVVGTAVAENSADVVIVDRRARPGGHWHDGYPFTPRAPGAASQAAARASRQRWLKGNPR